MSGECVGRRGDNHFTLLQATEETDLADCWDGQSCSDPAYHESSPENKIFRRLTGRAGQYSSMPALTHAPRETSY
jgi:hypothetical protein